MVASSTIFLAFGMTRSGIEPDLPDHWQTLDSFGQSPG